MEKRKLDLAKSVMRKLNSHPGSGLFLIKVEAGPDFPDDYFRIVKNPIDLRTIEKRLSARKYRSIEDWSAAVNLCFDNAVQYYQDGAIVDLAEEMRSVFIRESHVFDLLRVDGWAREVMALRDKIAKLNANVPKGGAFAIGGIDGSKRISEQLPSESEMRALISAVKKLKDQEAHNHLADLIRNEEPYLTVENGEEKINLLDLKPSTFFKVREFVQVKFEEMGIPYPGQ